MWLYSYKYRSLLSLSSLEWSIKHDLKKDNMKTSTKEYLRQLYCTELMKCINILYMWPESYWLILHRWHLLCWIFHQNITSPWLLIAGRYPIRIMDALGTHTDIFLPLLVFLRHSPPLFSSSKQLDHQVSSSGALVPVDASRCAQPAERKAFKGLMASDVL